MDGLDKKYAQNGNRSLSSLMQNQYLNFMLESERSRSLE